jgi:hypothetical protein
MGRRASVSRSLLFAKSLIEGLIEAYQRLKLIIKKNENEKRK